MNRERLKELEDGQMEKTSKLFDDLEHKILVKNESIEILDFYPEIAPLLKDKTYTNWVMRQQSVISQLPFYDTIIMPLIPIKDEKLYRTATGITVSQTIDLYKRKKVIPILQFPPMDFDELEYMDPILELDLPVINFRMPMYDQFISVYVLNNHPEQMKYWHYEGVESYKKIINDTTKYPPSITNFIPKTAQNEMDFLNNIGYCYARLNLMGYSHIIEYIFSLRDPMAVAQCFWMFEHVLVGGNELSLGGVVSWNSLDAFAAKKLGMNIKEFPTDVGKILIQEFKLASVEDFGYDKILKITSQTGKARKALFDLDLAVEKNQIEKIIDRSIALRNTWEEINMIIQSMEKHRRIISENIPVSIGIIGGLLNSLDLPGIISTLLGVITAKAINDPLADRIIKLKKPNHVISIFDLKKSIQDTI